MGYTARTRTVGSTGVTSGGTDRYLCLESEADMIRVTVFAIYAFQIIGDVTVMREVAVTSDISCA